MSQEFLRRNAFLVAAVALPLVVIGFFLVATAIPRWTVPPPSYDLLFTTNDYSPSRPPELLEFTVRGDRLQVTARPAPPNTHPARTRLWVFDHDTMAVREIPVEVPALARDGPPRTIEVAALAGRRLLAQPQAPDGYEVREPNSSSPGIAGELFGMRNRDRRLSIVKDGRVVPIEIPPAQDRWISPVFLAWIVDGTGM